MEKVRYNIAYVYLTQEDIDDFKRFATEEDRTALGQVSYLMSNYVKNKRRLEAAELLLSKDLNEID